MGADSTDECEPHQELCACSGLCVIRSSSQLTSSLPLSHSCCSFSAGEGFT